MNLVAIFLANAMGFMLTILILIANKWTLRKTVSREINYLRIMLYVTAASCLTDVLVAFVDGKPSDIARIINYIGNTWLYLADMTITSVWVVTVMFHLYHKKIYPVFHPVNVLVILGLIGLCINPIYPLIFTINEANVYARGPLFWYYAIIDALFAFTALGLYVNARLKIGKGVRIFPVFQMGIPAFVGLVAQVCIFGISTVWPFVSISLFGIVNGLQNELVYNDQLTGVYNRFYLDNALNEAKLRGLKISCLMLDLNNFKLINDTYGHTCGDQALIEISNVLKDTVGDFGTVCRYAGDEFVIILKSQQVDIVEAMTTAIRKALDEFNSHEYLPCKLSVSIGSSVVDLETQSIDDILSIIDEKMYVDKAHFYFKNPEMNRRKN